MMELTFSLPVSAGYGQEFSRRGSKGSGRGAFSKEERRFRDFFYRSVGKLGISRPVPGRVSLLYVVYPHRPDDWRELVKMDPECWDDGVPCEGLGRLGGVLLEVLSGVAFEDVRCVRKLEGERAVPDGRARIEVRIEPIPDTGKRREVGDRDETQHGTSYFFPPGTIVATPSGRQAMVLRYMNGTGKSDNFERALCRYLDAHSKRECVTLQPRFLRRIT